MKPLSRRRVLHRGFELMGASIAASLGWSCVADEPEPGKRRDPVQIRVLIPNRTDALVEPIPEWMEVAAKGLNATEPDTYRLQLMILETRSSDWASTLAELMSAGTPMDLATIHLGDIFRLQANRALLELEIYQKRDTGLDLDDYFEPVLAALSWEGRLYALPFITSPIVTYYARKLFTAANLSPPNRNWKWEDLLSLATAITRDLDGDGNIDLWGFLQLPGSPPSVQYIWQNGGEVIDLDGSVRLDKPAAREAIEHMAYLVQESGVSPSLRNLSLEQMGQLVERSRVGMFQFHVSTGIFWRSESLSLNLAEPPQQRQRATTLTTSGIAIGAETVHKDQAWTALRALVTSLERVALLPPRKSLSPQ